MSYVFMDLVGSKKNTRIYYMDNVDYLIELNNDMVPFRDNISHRRGRQALSWRKYGGLLYNPGREGGNGKTGMKFCKFP